MKPEMKKYMIVAAMAGLLGTAACNKLEIAPKDEINDREMAYKNDVIRNQILTGIYSLLYNDATWGNMIPIRLEAATDVQITRMSTSGSPENNSHTSQSDLVEENWRVLYQGINAANEFLYYSDLYVPDGENKTQSMGEARFLRAYFYFTLVRLYGDVPFRTQPTFDVVNTDIARTSAVEVYDFIVKELEKAQGELGDPLEVSYGRVSKTAAQTALADVYLNLAGELMKNRLPADSTSELMHRRAAYWCEQVLANPAHDIAATEYSTVFLNQVRSVTNVAEQVWELQPKYMIEVGYRCDSRLGKYNGMGNAVDGVYNARAAIYAGIPLRNLYGKLSADDLENDDRYDWNCPWTRIGAGSKLGSPVYVEIDKQHRNIYRLFPGKWRTIFANTVAESSDINYSGARLSIYRIADVHLMYAEALNAGSDDQAGAIAQINKVRARAHASAIPDSPMPSKEEVFGLIVDERARELCYEGKRRFDLIRWGLYETKVREAAKTYENPQPNASWVTTAMLAGFVNFNAARHEILPIPQSEISRNALIPQSEQNEGWGGNRKWK